MKDLMDKFCGVIARNPRTSLAGLGVIISGLLTAFHVITVGQGESIAGGCAALGLLMSGDGK